jgi:hypothetical protein
MIPTVKRSTPNATKDATALAANNNNITLDSLEIFLNKEYKLALN